MKTSEKKELEELVRWYNELDRYPGSVSDYNLFTGKEHVEINISGPDKTVEVCKDVEVHGADDLDFLRFLRNEGCVAFVHFYYYTSGSSYIGHGVPIKKGF